MFTDRLVICLIVIKRCQLQFKKERDMDMTYNKDDLELEEMDVVTLNEDGVDKEYAICSVFEVEGEVYAALSPIVDDDVVDDEEVMFFRYQEEGDEVILDEIESDEELEAIVEEYEELCKEEDL